jgi:threonine dehydrogenase-like Zn-dependent dehydrogenase
VRSLWLEAQALRVREDVPLPVPPVDEALVRVHLAGICNTDLELVRGYYPFAGVPGHEFVGTVVSAAAAPAWVGRRVAGEINAACGSCVSCRAGRPTHCEKRTVLGIVARDGAFATHLRLPIRNLHAVPDALPDEAAVFVEPTAAALEVQQQVAVSPADRVVVIGAGKLGHLVAQTLAVTGCSLVVAGRSARSLELLAARGIATAPVSALEPRAADLVVECTIRTASSSRAASCARAERSSSRAPTTARRRSTSRASWWTRSRSWAHAAGLSSRRSRCWLRGVSIRARSWRRATRWPTPSRLSSTRRGRGR